MPDGNEFQLITWSKDSTLRFWPIGSDVMLVSSPSSSPGVKLTPLAQRTGYTAEDHSMIETKSRVDVTVSYRKPPANANAVPTVSIPLGQMAIFDQVRAMIPGRASVAPSTTTSRASASGMRTPAAGFAKQRPSLRPLPTTAQSHIGSITAQHVVSASMPARRGGTMTRGARSSTRMDQLQWLSSIKREPREGSNSGTESGNTSRIHSRSRPPSWAPERCNENQRMAQGRQRSESRSRGVEGKEGEAIQSLKDEYVAHSCTRTTNNTNSHMTQHRLYVDKARPIQS